ncbi:glycosyl hydrolase family 18 protein [Populibacterium corticicola]|uniref:chitinase n=1 Tax=Populibacterium corticicola TaxID=1812826 RepID=A0ABW5XE59_9MICO
MISQRKAALGATLAGALAASMFTALPATAAQDDARETTTINGYRNVGYYGSWRPGSGATIKKVFVDSGAAQNLTHINYSFGNVAGDNDALDAARAAGVKGLDGVTEYSCFISDTPAPAQGETKTAGDAQNDFLNSVSAKDSVLGIADKADQKLAGNLNQLKQLKQLYPDLKINISLGGWTWSKSFSAAVATPERRANLVSSCIDLYIKGNLPEIDGRGGEGVAAGIFDGFDLDWEWPGAPDWAQEVGNLVDPENDKANFIAFTDELRAQLDALEVETHKEYEISAFIPASPGVITAGGWDTPELWKNLDFGNIQGYDLWGSWTNQTGHQGNVYGDPNHNWGLGLDTIVATYTRAGVDPAKLNLGLAAYAQSWLGAEEEPWTIAESGAPAQVIWDDLKKKDLNIHHEYTEDGKFNATWGYDPADNTFYSFDDEVAVAEKTKWAISLGLGGVDFWESGNDSDGDLSAASAKVLREAAPGPVAGSDATLCEATPSAAATPWNALKTYTSGDLVFLDGQVYKAQWYAKGDVPGTTTGPWSALTGCGVDPVELQAWNSSTVYTTGDQVIYGGETYTAAWWTRGQEPGASSVWKK